MDRLKWMAGVLLFGMVCAFTVRMQYGIVGATRKPGSTFTGCICHGSIDSTGLGQPNPATQVWIDAPDTVVAGSTSTFHLHVIKSGNIAAGFNVAAWYGILDTVASSGVHVMEGELTHQYPRLASGSDTISWLFYYQAPSSAGVMDTLYANGNSVNLDYAPDTSDVWNFAENKLVYVKDNVVSVPDRSGPVLAVLNQNHPNPFNPATTITYALRRAGPVELKIYNSLGHSVRTLERTIRSEGNHQAVWDGRDDAGRRTGSGVYFYRLTSGTFSAVKRMIMLK